MAAVSNYVDASVQTVIAGLANHPSIRPPPLSLSPQRDAPTPPDDMLVEKFQLPAQLPSHDTPAISTTNMDDPNTLSTLLLRRKNRPSMVARISLPPVHFDFDEPMSPPPTETVLSPLPAANKLHAGHTPIMPRALSPLQMPEDFHDASSGHSTPELQDEALSGPLTLPLQPNDGTADYIELRALDAELEKIARERKLKGLEDEENLSTTQLAGNGSQPSPNKAVQVTRRRRSSTDDVEVYDGVILKKPRMNLGAPLGQA